MYGAASREYSMDAASTFMVITYIHLFLDAGIDRSHDEYDFWCPSEQITCKTDEFD